MKEKERVFEVDQIDLVAKEILIELGKPGPVGFSGPMGSGKTTFIAALCRQLQTEPAATSPTFSLIQVYDSPTGPVWHADAWRLERLQEAETIGLLEWLDQPIWGFIEWVEKVIDYFPEDRPVVELQIIDPHLRKVQINHYI